MKREGRWDRPARQRTDAQSKCGHGCRHATNTAAFQQGLLCAKRDRKAKKYDPRVLQDKDFCQAWRDGYAKGGEL